MERDPFYFGIICAARALFAAQGLKFTVTGEENIPADGGAVVVINHTGYMDFTYGGIPFRSKKRYLRYMAKAEIWDNAIAGPLMRGMKHIPVDRIDGSASYRTAIDYLRRGRLVALFPESTISRSFEIKDMRNGAVRMAQEAGVPIIPMVMVGSQRVWTKGFPKHLGRTNTPIHISVMPAWNPTGDPDAETTHLRQMMTEELHRVWDAYAEAHGPLPAGAYWVPARLGGGAPTLEEAQKDDDAVAQERQRIRALRDDLNALAENLRAAAASVVETSQDKLDDWQDKLNDDLLANLKNTLDEIAADIRDNTKEGSKKIADAAETVRTSWTELLNNTKNVSSQQLDSLISQAKQLRDKIPTRLDRALPAQVDTIVSDIDGTLLLHLKPFSPATVEALKNIDDAGLNLILATGRPLDELPQILEQLPVTPLIISANGAVVYDSATQKVLHADGFPPEIVRELRDRIAATLPEATLKISEVECDGGSTVVKILVRRPGIPSADMIERLEAYDEKTDTPVRELATVTYSVATGIIELSPLGVTKATGLEWVANQRGLELGHTIAFGNMPNDTEMLQAVGLGCAVADAHPDVVRIADYVAPACGEDGVATVCAAVLERAR